MHLLATKSRAGLQGDPSWAATSFGIIVFSTHRIPHWRSQKMATTTNEQITAAIEERERTAFEMVGSAVATAVLVGFAVAIVIGLIMGYRVN